MAAQKTATKVSLQKNKAANAAANFNNESKPTVNIVESGKKVIGGIVNLKNSGAGGGEKTPVANNPAGSSTTTTAKTAKAVVAAPDSAQASSGAKSATKEAKVKAIEGPKIKMEAKEESKKTGNSTATKESGSNQLNGESSPPKKKPRPVETVKEERGSLIH